jgi:hypothetical protein
MHRQVFCVYNLNLSLWGPSGQLTISGMLLMNQYWFGLNVELKFARYMQAKVEGKNLERKKTFGPLMTRSRFERGPPTECTQNLFKVGGCASYTARSYTYRISTGTCQTNWTWPLAQQAFFFIILEKESEHNMTWPRFERGAPTEITQNLYEVGWVCTMHCQVLHL